MLALIFLAAHLGGYPGEKLDTLLKERVFSDFARGACYEETVNAFRTHYDDVHPQYDWHAVSSGTWQCEYWGKTTIGLVGAARYTGDAKLKAFVADRTRAFVKEFQHADGYLSTYKDKTFLAERGGMTWNLWGMKYTLWGLLEVHELTGDAFFLDAAAKLMDWQIDAVHSRQLCIRDLGSFDGLPVMSVLKPLMVLYGKRSEPRYLAYAREIVDNWRRSDGKSPNLVSNGLTGRNLTEWYPGRNWAKGYELMSGLEGLVAYARAVSDSDERETVLKAVRNIVDALERDELSAVLSVSVFDHFIGAKAYDNAVTELCDAIHWARINYALWDVTKDGRYLDNAERVFLNAILAGVYRNGKWCSNAVHSHGFDQIPAPHEVAMKYHQCCVDNSPRAFFDYATYAFRDGCLNFYTPLEATDESRRLKVEVGAGYPFAEKVVVKVTSGAEKATIRLRVPEGARLSVNGAVETPDPKTRQVAVALHGGENALELKFAFEAVIKAKTVAAKKPGTDPFEDWAKNVWEAWSQRPDYAPLWRTEPASTVMYGPVLLAKGLRAGSAEKEILGFTPVSPTKTKVTYMPDSSPKPGFWTTGRLVFCEGDSCRFVSVCDFASVADSDEKTLFSIYY